MNADHNHNDYRHRAEIHRPRDQDTIRVAAHELATRGLTFADIGQALGLNPAQVRQLLGDAPQ